MRTHRAYMILLYAVPVFFCCVLMLPLRSANAHALTAQENIGLILDQECVNLKKDKLKELLLARFPNEIDAELARIIQGVVKKTDFDNISEEKTAEIISLVNESYKRGAPLEQLDQLFDVAYERTVSVENMAAAAKALKELSHSDVPAEIAEEFVYHSLEEAWDPAALPVLTRGLIYGVDRGLTPQRIGLILMLDVQQGALAKKSADQVVLDTIKLVREKEPKNWKPMKQSERELAEKQEQKRKLDALQREAEEKKLRKEAEKKKADEELQRMRSSEQSASRRAEQERLAKQMDAMLRASQEEVRKYQQQQKELSAGLARHHAEMEQEKLQKDQVREEQRRKQLAEMKQSIASTGRSERLDIVKLYAAVDRHIGIPYRYGGDSEAGIDCSAFTRRVYRVNNIELPRTSNEQAHIGLGVNESIMQAGDLVFFDTSIMGRISHVGVYLGSGVFAHASSSKGVTKSNIREKYYTKRFVKANRILDM